MPKFGHKYKAKPQRIDDYHFASKLEASYYKLLKTKQQAGEVLFFIRQPRFDLPGEQYVADFLVFYDDGSCEVVDCKGYETPQFKRKRKLLENTYPFELKLVKRV